MYRKREVEEFQILLVEAEFLITNEHSKSFSKDFPAEIAAGLLGGTAIGVAGVGTVVFAFTGMSGAEIMGALATFGVGGAALGIASIAVAVLFPVGIVAGGSYTLTNQRKLKKMLQKLIVQSHKFEKQLSHDDRAVAVGMVKGISDYRSNLQNKHKGLIE